MDIEIVYLLRLYSTSAKHCKNKGVSKHLYITHFCGAPIRGVLLHPSGCYKTLTRVFGNTGYKNSEPLGGGYWGGSHRYEHDHISNVKVFKESLQLLK